MFDAAHQHLAARIIERAKAGLRGGELLAAVREEFPHLPARSITRAAFIAVTRPSVSPEALSSIYEMAIQGRRRPSNETGER